MELKAPTGVGSSDLLGIPALHDDACQNENAEQQVKNGRNPENHWRPLHQDRNEWCSIADDRERPEGGQSPPWLRRAKCSRRLPIKCAAKQLSFRNPDVEQHSIHVGNSIAVVKADHTGRMSNTT